MRYRERLRVPIAWWVIGMFFAVSFATAVGFAFFTTVTFRFNGQATYNINDNHRFFSEMSLFHGRTSSEIEGNPDGSDNIYTNEFGIDQFPDSRFVQAPPLAPANTPQLISACAISLNSCCNIGNPTQQYSI